jgi:hypothetical protein
MAITSLAQTRFLHFGGLPGSAKSVEDYGLQRFTSKNGKMKQEPTS